MRRIKQNRQGIPIVILIAAAIIGISVFWYYNQLNEQTYSTTIANVRELAEHDQKSIISNIYRTWTDLEAVHYRMMQYPYGSLREIQERLQVEQDSCVSDKICYVAENGMIYSGDYRISKNNAMIQPFLDGEDRFVLRYRNENPALGETQTEYLVYGISVEPWKVGDIVFSGIICQTAIDSIQSDLLITSYNDMGYSSVIDQDGNYIIDIQRAYDGTHEENFYDTVKNGTFASDGVKLKTVEEKIEEGEAFTLNYTDENGDKSIMTFQKIDEIGWYFIMVVSEQVLLEQSRSMMKLSGISIGFIAVIIFFIFVLLYLIMRDSVRIKSQLEARSEFLSNMSHEIRTPLNGLIGLNHLMANHIDDRDRTMEYLQKSSDTAQYLLALLNDILDMSKLQAGKVELKPAPADLRIIADNIVSMQKSNIESRGLDFQVECDIPYPYISCDEVRLKQVLMNLLSNAAKFTPEGGSVTLKIRQKEPAEGKIESVIQVVDTGCGMSEEFCGHIFEAFTQEKNKNSDRQKGTGLGMAISYLLMKEMGGDLSVESKLDEGSCFTAVFRALTVPEEEFRGEAVALERPDTEPEKQKARRVLIAEDVELNAEILREILADMEIDSEIAVNGREAVEKFTGSEPGTFDAIFMDVQMPVMNGYEAAKAIRQSDRTDAKDILIFACTANTFQEDIDRAKESGMNDFISKPIHIDELMKKLTLLDG